ncbi:GIY-YIG nuclease family protein [Parasalinivibrio latis]|uniref:GIY-YIG nuclease family protein n=1 Tax=Parasalinivibrio latis TaxID=2952610 RepID=UPI0030E1612E
MSDKTPHTSTDWYMYVIRTACNSLYCGVTTDVERRFTEHQSGGKKSAKYVRGKLPLKLAVFCMVGNKSEALKAEYRFKQLAKSRKEKLCLTEEALKKWVSTVL